MGGIRIGGAWRIYICIGCAFFIWAVVERGEDVALVLGRIAVVLGVLLAAGVIIESIVEGIAWLFQRVRRT